MAHAISMDDGETRATPNQRFEALMRRAVPPDYQQELGDDDLHKFMDRDLYKATKEGDVKKFIDALEKVIESRKLALSLILNQVTPSGNSLLHVAASRFGSDDVMEELSDDDVMEELSDDVMELILNHFPHIMTRKNSSEDTPLHVAVQDGRFGATEKLIHRETNSEIIYWKNEDGKSPLYLAVENCDRWGWPDHEAVERKIFKLLFEEFARDEAYAVKIQGMSPILAALKEWNQDLLKEIIDGLPKLLHVRDEDGGTPMHAAASVGNRDAIVLLLEKCPYLALQTDKNGSYPIHIACEAGDSWVIGPLLEDTWPDLAEIKNKKRQNILHVAVKGGNYSAVDRVLEKYSEPDTIKKLVNAKDVDGNTPLHLASMHNHCPVMRSLTKVKRIDLRLRNNDGLTALDVAMESRSLSTRNPALIGRAILIIVGVPRSEGRDVLSLPREQGSGVSKSSPTEWIKDWVNTLLLVATLVASVTLTAGLTLPGGYNASSDLHPGTATMLYHRMFRVFLLCNGQTRKESSPLYLAVEDEHSEILTLSLAIPFGPSRIQGMSPVRAAVTHWNLVNFSFKFQNEKLSLQALIQG
ncbi:hypothetical protein ACJRO7_006763 [Eucalyptus globulus]|uniref:PGG domain-containing protein n=1 Tax=Eucalyptus globulus TaxID=34317 RepID=A0ABD3IML3_EUCGL